MRAVNAKWIWFGSAFALLVISLVSWMAMREGPAPEAERILIYDFSVKNPTGRVVRKADLWVSVPAKDDKIEIKTLESSHGYKIEIDDQGNQRAVISLIDIAPFSTESISLNMKLLVRQRSSKFSAGDLQAFLAASPLIETADKGIIDLSEQLQQEEPYLTVSSIYEWVASNIDYVGFIRNDRGAQYALEQKRGDCTEFAYLSTALARVAGLPARAVGGFVLGKGFKLNSSTYHNWAEILIDGRWVLVDPQNRVFDKKYDSYIVMNRLTGKRKSQQFFGVDAPLVARMN